MATVRSVSEVKARCKAIMNRTELLQLVHYSNSPSAAYTLVMTETGSDALAKAGRWLAVLRRDYSFEYESFLQSTQLRPATEARQEQDDAL